MISFLWHCPSEFRDWPLFMSGEGWWFWFCHDKIRALEYSYVLPLPPPPPPLSPSPQWQKISSQFFIAPAFILFLATTDPLSIPPVNPSLNPPSFPFPPPLFPPLPSFTTNNWSFRSVECKNSFNGLFHTLSLWRTLCKLSHPSSEQTGCRFGCSRDPYQLGLLSLPLVAWLVQLANKKIVGKKKGK